MICTPSSPATPGRTFRSRLWLKLLLAYLLPTGLIVSGIGLLAYQAARNAMEHQLGQTLMAIARTAAQQVGRARALSLQPGEEQTRTYRNLVERLAELAKSAGVERIVLFDPGERALVDSQSAFAIGEPVAALAANRAEIQQVFGGQDRASVLFTGRDGTLYKTGFAPVRHEGQVLAAVGVDGSAAFFVPLNRLGRTLALGGAVALALVALVTVLVSRGITRPIHRLAEAARAIGQGELEGEIRVEASDEIGVLASTLNEMRRSILARDRQLQMMLSGIAHEVRNPLGGMTLFVELLREEIQEEGARRHVERIATELDYLARVVNDFLDFARMKPPELVEVDPGVEFEQVRSLSETQLGEAGVSLDLQVATGLRTVRWDQERMRSAIINLVRNAIQASSPGTRVQLALEPDPQGGLCLRVEDQGAGIPAAKLTRIFEPFYTTRQKGTGLGLALVRKTVEDHDGTIQVTSEQGRGTRFEIHLPNPPGESNQEDTRWPMS